MPPRVIDVGLPHVSRAMVVVAMGESIVNGHAVFGSSYALNV
jgi:hypothetical protein